MNKRDILFAKAVSGGGSSPVPTLIEKSVTENGTYNASDDEADGYSKVTVNVEQNAILENSPTSFKPSVNISYIKIPNGVTEIAQQAFNSYERLETIDFPTSVTNIAANAFIGCQSLKNVNLNEGLLNIRNTAFNGCTSLEYIEIPASVTTLNRNIFYGCSALSTIKFKGSVPPSATASDTFNTLPTTCKILVPAGTLSAYTSEQNYPDPNTYQYIEY